MILLTQLWAFHGDLNQQTATAQSLSSINLCVPDHLQAEYMVRASLIAKTSTKAGSARPADLEKMTSEESIPPIPAVPLLPTTPASTLNLTAPLGGGVQITLLVSFLCVFGTRKGYEESHPRKPRLTPT
ncbi:hypothetical protein V6Z11_A06G214800 [Gossypium hirsutum]